MKERLQVAGKRIGIAPFNCFVADGAEKLFPVLIQEGMLIIVFRIPRFCPREFTGHEPRAIIAPLLLKCKYVCPSPLKKLRIACVILTVLTFPTLAKARTPSSNFAKAALRKL